MINPKWGYFLYSRKIAWEFSEKTLENPDRFRYFNTMLAKKGPVVAISNSRTPRTPLENLYARRLALDALIESLEDYERCRSKRLDLGNRKTA